MSRHISYLTCSTVLQPPGRPERVTLEGTLDDGPSVSPKAECQCIVVFDVRNVRLAQQYFRRVFRFKVPRDLDAFVVIHVHLVTPPCTEPGQRVQVQCAIAS
jgi:hypothetical protein